VATDPLPGWQYDGGDSQALNRRVGARPHPALQHWRPDWHPTAPAALGRRWVRVLWTGLCITVLVGRGVVGLEPAAALGPAVIVHGASSDQRAWLDDAMARFEAAGLRLPDFEIAFNDESGCAGHLGGFRRTDDVAHISVCSDLQFVVLHELAHAWLDANVDEAARDRYLRWRRLETWSDHAVPTGQRGVEDAAFVLQQNLRDVAPRVLASATWTGRIVAFELLTGTRSPLRARAAGLVSTPVPDQAPRSSAGG
jgi:hypothetical protein